MESITAVIITKNEERNIGRCLASLQGVADEVVVVDSGSTDATETLCRQAGARFVSHPWEGYAAQKNYANSLASHGWTLSLDADEALSPTLRESLLRLKAEGLSPRKAYSFNRLSNWCGHWIRHCGWYPDSKVRLWPSGKATWDGLVHEELLLAPGLQQQHLEGDLLHYTYYTVADHMQRLATYADLGAHKAFRPGRRYSRTAVALKPMWTFFRGYILKRGFLDGMAGFAVCRLEACYTLAKYATLYNLSHKKES